MSKDKEKMTKEEKIKKATELIVDLKALELSDKDIEDVVGGATNFIGTGNIEHGLTWAQYQRMGRMNE